jgi:hypothetical protein
MMRRRGENFLERKFPPRAPLSKNFGKKKMDIKFLKIQKTFFKKFFGGVWGKAPISRLQKKTTKVLTNCRKCVIIITQSTDDGCSLPNMIKELTA